MVLAYTLNTPQASNMLLSARNLSVSLKKDFGICCADGKLDAFPAEWNYKTIEPAPANSLQSLSDLCEQFDVSFLFIQLSEASSSVIKKALKYCRDLRIPYLFFKDSFPVMQLSKVFLPVGYLEEEVEKAQFASAFGRFCNSRIYIFQANDYGSKAAENVRRMKDLFDKFSLEVVVQKASTDSFRVDKEIVNKGAADDAGLVIISASRDYGLDDLVFGPKELHLIKKSVLPLLLVNPRGDLYALCD